MGSGHIGKTTNGPDDVLGTTVQSEREDIWGEMPARVVSFNSAKQEAVVQPMFKKRLDGVPTDLPQLTVPVRFARAGGGAMTFPVKAGDMVTLRSQMRDMDAYHEDGKAFDAVSTRSHSLADMEAHVAGGESLSDPIKGFDSSNAHIRFDEDGKFGIRGSKDGKLAIEGAQGNAYTIIAEFMEMVAADNHQGSPHQFKAQMTALAAKIRGMAL